MKNSKKSVWWGKRELMSWSDDSCQCFHSEESHQVDMNCLGLRGPNLDLDCNCTEYHPKDNLIYLEYKFKEKRKSERRKRN